ncbi:anti-adapter protein IraP [Erwinia billingiae]|uniref:anti-adapter protein IraP n=1 Tax=Erwinia billingiae TaxID=182337 RepID=UPI000CFFE9FE|nr:anti-adapter protein IraP [Erwinia billingiae]PRB61260.1 anti-adapter protein IraP [Erwinia billingiae]
MKNVIFSMLAKISKMDAESKQLTAQVEAQSLLIGALTLTVGKNGGMTRMVESVNKAINSVLDSQDDVLRSDADILLNEFRNLLEVTRLIEQADAELDQEALAAAGGDSLGILPQPE